MFLKFFSLAVAVFCLINLTSAAEPDFNSSISFWAQPSKGSPIRLTSKLNSTLQVCNKSGKFAIVTHGWLGSCTSEWIIDLMSNLTVSRGGCIICMDYNNFSKNPDYFGLVNQYPSILNVLVLKLKQLKQEGFNPSLGFMYGFSYGAHLVVNAANQAYGNKTFGQIDVCEPAGPGFDWTPKLLDNFALAAKNVQCIHTSSDKGTYFRTCTQNFNLGVCGWWQYAQGPFPKGSHGLCPYMYNSAFKNPFPAVTRMDCPQTPRTLNVWPLNYRFGYSESRTAAVNGTLFVNTFTNFPYNK